MPRTLKTGKGFMKKGSAELGTGSNITGLAIANGSLLPVFKEIVFNDSQNIIREDDYTVTLKKGFKFKIRLNVGCLMSGTGASTFVRIKNITDSLTFPLMTYIINATDITNGAISNHAKCTIKTDKDIKIGIVNANDTITQIFAGSSIEIDEMEPYLIPTYSDENFFQPLRQNTEITVGTGGQFATINDAFNWLAKRRPNRIDVKAIVKLLSGFVMKEQLSLKNGDWSWVQIDSVDAEVSVNKILLTTINSENTGSPCMFDFNNCTAPTINVLFNSDKTGTNYLRAFEYIKSNGKILNGKGAKNFSNDLGLVATDGSVVRARGAIFINCTTNIAAISGSTINCEDAILTGGTNNCVGASENSRIACSGADMSTGTNSIACDRGSTVVACLAKLGGTVRVDNGSTIVITGATGTISPNIAINTIANAYGVIFR